MYAQKGGNALAALSAHLIQFQLREARYCIPGQVNCIELYMSQVVQPAGASVHPDVTNTSG